MYKRLRLYKTAAIVGIIMLVSAFEAFACNVPVFRYALERWAADPYDIVVFHEGALTDSQTSVLEWLEDPVGDDYRHANLAVRTVDLGAEPETYDRELFERLGDVTLPVAAVRYPGNGMYRLAVMTKPLEREALVGLLTSPVRRRIAEDIVGGTSVVWVLVESGDGEKDDRAAALLRERLDDLEQRLELPEELEGNEAFAPVDLSTGPELKIAFDLIRVSRDDSAEAALVSMLTHMEPDLEDYRSEPMAFPVYGRGRGLYALVGNGITDRNIEAACRFLVGACSCEVKDLNPGVDLLIAFDWDSGIGDTWIDEDLPPLVGITEMVKLSDAGDESTGESQANAAQAAEPVAIDAVEEPPAEGGHPLGRNIAVVIVLMVAAVGALTFFTTRKKTGSRS